MMSNHDVLTSLFQRLNNKRDTYIVSYHETKHWSEQMLPMLLKEKLLTIAVPNYVVECPGCEANCLRDAATSSTGLLVLCGTEDGYIEEIPIGREQIQQWQFTTKQVAYWIAGKLDLSGYVQRDPTTGDYRLGFNAQGKLLLTSDAYLSLKVNQSSRSINELLEITDNHLALNLNAIKEKNSPDKTPTEKKQKPPSAKLRVNMSETQKRQAGWQKMYREQLKNHSDKSKTWHSEQIAKKIAEKGEKPVSAKHIFKYLKS